MYLTREVILPEPVYCFIDDSPFEIQLFKDVIEPVCTGVRFVYSDTFIDGKEQLEQSNLAPSLFILDLYGSQGIETDRNIPSLSQLQSAVETIPDLKDVFTGLEKLEHNHDSQINEYLKRLFGVFNGWRNMFRDQCVSLDQGSKYGIGNLKRVRESYPSTAAVMYTRKGLFTDAIELFKHNCDGVFIKPNGPGDEGIYAATRSQADALLKDWDECIRKRETLA